MAQTAPINAIRKYNAYARNSVVRLLGGWIYQGKIEFFPDATFNVRLFPNGAFDQYEEVLWKISI
jgi:hypothetical protein